MAAAGGFEFNATPCSLRFWNTDPAGSIVTRKHTFVNHFLMETIITSENDLRSYEQSLPADAVVVHFKIVGVGPNTLAKAGYMGNKICDVATQPEGFFVIASSMEEVKKAMHDLVDLFCAKQEETNESAN